MFAVLLAASLVASSYAACGFPNGTETAFHWWQAPGTGRIAFSGATPVDANGNAEYPLRMTAPLHIKLQYNNQEKVITSPNGLVSIKMFTYGADCSWREVYTFGLLDNLDGCALNVVECPILLGEHESIATLDLSRYDAIIGLLRNDAPYQLQLTFTEKMSGDYVTLYAQARAFTK